MYMTYNFDLKLWAQERGVLKQNYRICIPSGLQIKWAIPWWFDWHLFTYFEKEIMQIWLALLFTKTGQKIFVV